MANASGFFQWGLPYQTVSISVGPGVNTLSFVTYNTLNTNAPSGLFIDNVVVTPVASGNPDAAVTLDNLFATYDGTAKPVTVTTNPPNLNVTVTYGGSAHGAERRGELRGGPRR